MLLLHNYLNQTDLSCSGEYYIYENYTMPKNSRDLIFNLTFNGFPVSCAVNGVDLSQEILQLRTKVMVNIMPPDTVCSMECRDYNCLTEYWNNTEWILTEGKSDDYCGSCDYIHKYHESSLVWEELNLFNASHTFNMTHFLTLEKGYYDLMVIAETDSVFDFEMYEVYYKPEETFHIQIFNESSD
jgi:hypothetical protein